MRILDISTSAVFLLSTLVLSRPAAAEEPSVQARTETPEVQLLPEVAPRNTARVPAEFEPGGAIVLCCEEFLDFYPETMMQIVRSVYRKTNVIAVVDGEEQASELAGILRAQGLPPSAVRIVQAQHDSLWVRDYGPVTRTLQNGRTEFLDARYVSRDIDRVNDDRIPVSLGSVLSITVQPLDIELDGGNLLTNGDGLFLTTSTLLDENADVCEEQELREMLAAQLGARRVVVLEPLVGENTGHVDMFATFVGRNTVVVGRFDPVVDSVNAALLDRNSARLRKVRTRFGPLRVVRVPMPPHSDDVWRTYTNVLFGRRTLLVPKYRPQDEATLQEAIRAYRGVLPGWRVVPIDAEPLAESGGALHCASLNLPRAAVRGLSRTPMLARRTTSGRE